MAVHPADLHERYEATLNGVRFQHDSDALPDPVPCTACGRPVWVGSITCLVDGHPDEGSPWSGAWELRDRTPYPSALGMHRCPARARPARPRS